MCHASMQSILNTIISLSKQLLEVECMVVFVFRLHIRAGVGNPEIFRLGWQARHPEKN
jgi:hypothetical protein